VYLFFCAFKPPRSRPSRFGFLYRFTVVVAVEATSRRAGTVEEVAPPHVERSKQRPRQIARGCLRTVKTSNVATLRPLFLCLFKLAPEGSGDGPVAELPPICAEIQDQSGHGREN
jgi:hypothetical protein